MSGWLDRNRNPIPIPNHNSNPKEGNREIFWLQFVFGLYFEVDDVMWGDCGYISEDCDIFVLDNILLRGWQAGTKISSYV